MYELTLAQIVSHVGDHEYMGGDIERTSARVNITGEVFTKSETVREILDNFDVLVFSDPTKTFLDPTCGDGQFLVEVLIRKVKNGIDFETALGAIYGVDLMPDNVALCKKRLLCGQHHLQHIVDKNIVCADSLTYDFSFNGTNKNDADVAFSNLFY